MCDINSEPGATEQTLNEVYWEKAFRLASFLHSCLSDEEREKVASEVANEALRQLPCIAKEQRGRNFYPLKGQIYRSPALPVFRGAEHKDAEHKIKGKARSKINVREINLLQQKVFEESKKFEEEQEEGGSPIQLDQEDMLVRYLAYLVSFTMELSSFYVNLGLCRFVYNYNASETEGLYSFVIQDSPNRYKDGEYFRKRKGMLKKELEKRFGTRLKTVTGPRGEDHFQRAAEPEQFCDLLKLCLDEFQPWEVKCCLPARFNANDKLPELSFDSQQDKGDDSTVELNRIHSLIHPDCFGKLVGAKRYEEPEKRVALPLFFNAHHTAD